ncbi:LuxR C-terminal-related transcriptional regulator [Peterkaempfera bronchialis]|uniref:helix-turn-helix transcriptional regulator n=1 Tax=Peterkaempfera bronchialis TaxID=2126346 RepID=UPI003C2B99A0
MVAGEPDIDTSGLLGQLPTEADGLEKAAPVVRVVRAAAVLGDEFTPDALAPVAGLPQDRVLAALDILGREYLVRVAGSPALLAFRDRRLRKVVYDDTPLGERRLLHRRAAAELAGRGAPPTAVAGHVAQVAGFDHPEDIGILRRGAEACLRTAPELAATWAEIAVRLTPVYDPRRTEAQILLGQAWLLAGRPADARAVLHAALPSLAQPLPGAESSGAAYCMQAERMLGHYPEASAIGERTLAAVPAQGHPIAGMVHAQLAEVADQSGDDLAARRHADAALVLAREHCPGPVQAGAQALAAHAALQLGGLAEAQTATDEAARLADVMSDGALLDDLLSLHRLGVAELALERFGDAERHLLRAADLCRRTGQAYALPDVLAALAETCLRTGRLSLALSAAEEAEFLATRADRPDVRASAEVLRAHALLWSAASDSAEDALAVAERAVLLTRHLPWRWAVAVRARQAELLLCCGAWERGDRLLLEAAGGEALHGVRPGARTRLWELLATGAAARGDVAAAVRHSRRAAAGARWLPLPGVRAYARRAEFRVAAPYGERARALSEAADGFGRQSMRLEQCRTLLLSARRLIAARRGAEAVRQLCAAEELARACRSPRLGAEAAELRRLLSPDQPRTSGGTEPLTRLTGLTDLTGLSGLTGLAALTERERQVAELASAGLTSSGIAARLQLSVRTVDSHLGRIYRKLGVPNRTALAQRLLQPKA